MAAAGAVSQAALAPALRTGDGTERFLLRQAVDRPEAPDQIDSMDADDLMTGHQPRQDVQRHAIVRIVEVGTSTTPLAM